MIRRLDWQVVTLPILWLFCLSTLPTDSTDHTIRLFFEHLTTFVYRRLDRLRRTKQETWEYPPTDTPELQE